MKVLLPIVMLMLLTGCSKRVDCAKNPTAPSCPEIPVARIQGPTGPVNAGAPANFSGTSSTPAQNKIARYRWTCGQPGISGCNAEGPSVTFRYVKEGKLGSQATYTVTLTIEDTRGNSNTATATVNVVNVYGT